MTSLRRFALPGLVLLALTTLFAFGQGRPMDHQGRPDGPRANGPGGPGGPGGPPDPVMGLAGRILRDLDLSDAQKTQVRSVVRTHVDNDLKPLVQDFGEARHQLENLVWNPAASDKDIAQATDSLSQASLALEKGRHRLAADLLGVLTKSQQQSFHEMLASARPPMPPGPPPEDAPEGGR